jgi:hypothetical protein
MTTLLACPRCDRHVRDTDSACPFCAATVPGARGPLAAMVRGAKLVALSAATVGTLAACYGAPPRHYEPATPVDAEQPTPPQPPVRVYADGDQAWQSPKPDATVAAPEASLPAPEATLPAPEATLPAPEAPAPPPPPK